MRRLHTGVLAALLVALTGGACGSGSNNDAAGFAGATGTGGAATDASDDGSGGAGGEATGGTGAGTGGSATGGTSGSASGGTSGSATGGTSGSATGGTSGAAGSDAGSSADGGGATTDAGATCGTSPAPGLTHRSVMVGGVQRTYELYVPASLDPSKPVPLVLAHHGFTMTGDIMRLLTDYTSLADQEGFAVAFPDGIASTWNAGAGVCGAGALGSGTADDFGFVQAMIAAIDATQCVDHARVFLTGFSMGGYFANHIACTRPDLVRAVAPASGGGPPAGCLPGPKPVMILHGTADPLISYTCGVQARDYWVQHNGCSTDVDKVAVKGGTCEYSKGCPPGGQVVLCSFTGMGHGWAGHVYGIYGGGTQYEDATKLTWDFFKSQM